MESLSAKDLQIFREKSRAFCGSFKIPLDKLQHENLPDNPRQFDEKNEERLVNILSKSCERREEDNHVPALISRSALPRDPRRVGDDLPLFVPDHPLIYLHGRHRLAAADKFLIGNDRWWIADLYSDDLSLQVKNVLREHDPNCAKFYDGDVLRQILISTMGGDMARREKFLVRLSKNKQDLVKRLESQPEIFMDSLESLTPFAGLWPAVGVGTFTRLFNLHCPEENTRYLRRVEDTWTRIIGENDDDRLLIDPNTVHLLEGRCPGLSLEDRAFVQMRILAGDIFPAIKDENHRSAIFDRLCSIKHVIISLHTFLEDTKYLEPCARILKKLLPGKCKGSISQYFSTLHSGQRDVKVQTSEFTSEDRTLSSGSHASWLSYRQFWLFALRHFPEMDGQAPRKDIGKPNTWHPGLQFRWWVGLCTLAVENGYRRIRQIYRDRKAADLSMIEDCVRRILPAEYYNIDQEEIQRKARLIYQIIGEIAHAEIATTTPELTSDRDNCRPDISDKCGRPRVSVLKADKGYLFLNHIYSTSYDTTPKRYLTSFAITRDFFHSFFGTDQDDLDQPSTLQLPRDDNGGDPLQDVEHTEAPSSNHQTHIGESTTLEHPAQTYLTTPAPSSDLPSLSTEDMEISTSVAPNLAETFVENMSVANVASVTLPERRSRSPDGRPRTNQRSRSASPTTELHRSERRRDRSASYQRNRRRRADSGSPREENTAAAITPSAALPNPPAATSAENTDTSIIPSAPASPDSAGLFVEDSRTAIVPFQPFAAPIQDRYISFEDARRVLFRKRKRTKASSFTVLSPAGKDRFRIRQADFTDPVSMVNALQLPSEAPFIVRDQGKRLKLTAPITILEEARSQRLDTALMVSQHNTRELIRELEEREESEEESRRKDPYRAQTGMEIIRTNGKPINIRIWNGRDWKSVERGVAYSQTEAQVRQYMWKYPGHRPYDWEGNPVPVEKCFDAAQDDCPPSIYLYHPERYGAEFPVEL